MNKKIVDIAIILPTALVLLHQIRYPVEPSLA
jgi:hypothetical protein